MPAISTRGVRIALAGYRVLLRLYPKAFRDAFGGAMEATFLDAASDARERRGRRGLLVLSVSALADGLRSAVREHADVIASRTNDGGVDGSGGWNGGPKGRRDMDAFARELRGAVRGLVRRPWFTLMAVSTLALGIGANTALFSVVKTVLLEPLPYTDPGRVAMIWSRWNNFDKTWVSEDEYHNYRATMRSFEDLGLFYTAEVNVTEGDDPERVSTSVVTENVFPITGVAPLLGRGFTAEETRDNAPVLVISHEMWQRRYGGDASAIGRTIEINGNPRQIIGVMPAGYRLPLDFRTDRPTQLWFPYQLSVQPGTVQTNGGNHGSYAIGRLRAGVTTAMVNDELRSVVARLTGDGVYTEDFGFAAFAVTAPNEVTGALRPALLVLLGAVGFVLLIACANVANLLLVHGEARRSEFGVRRAVGASGGQILRQLFTENALLGVAGGMVGVWLAWAGVAALRGLAPAELPRVDEARIDAVVLAFTALLSVATAAITGLIPAWKVLRTDARSVMAEGGRANTAGSERSRARRMLVTAELGLAVVLAAGAGLMLRSFRNLIEIDPGFRAESVLTMRLSVPSAFYPDDPAVTGFYSELLRRVRALPRVESAGLIRVLPIDQEIGDSCVTVDGYMPPPGQCAATDWQAASDGYFESMGQRVIEGRAIEAGDTRDAPQVIVVNEEFVRRFMNGGPALGRPVTFGFMSDVKPQTIVGVVADTRHNGLTGEVKPTFYRPHAQWAVSTGFPQRSVSLVVRTAGDAELLAGPVRSEIRNMDARLPVSSIQSMTEVLSRAVAQPRFTLVLLLAFGALALVLAIIGVYGVVSWAVAARRQELGVRMALGATPGAVVWLSLRQGLTYATIGIVAGGGTALIATRLMRGLVYEVPTTDPLTYATVVLGALVVSFCASWVPARRAAKTDPLAALRESSR